MGNESGKHGTGENKGSFQATDKATDKATDRATQKAAEEAPIAELATARESGLTVEVLRFVAHTRKWWLAPIIIMMLMVAGLLVLTGTGVAPLIYALF